jgi:hypothetical protein
MATKTILDESEVEWANQVRVEHFGNSSCSTVVVAPTSRRPLPKPIY